LKHPVARAFDALREGLADGRRTLAADPVLRDEATRLPQQVERIMFQLDPGEANILSRKLRAFLQVQRPHLVDLVRLFLQVDDRNFAARHAFFYEHVAPLIRLYNVRLGETMTLQSVTHAGYHKSVQVKVMGTFEFVGLDRSTLVSSNNLMDLITFRELYGARSKEQEEELDSIRRSVHVADIEREAAEAEMFTEAHVGAERATAGEATATSSTAGLPSRHEPHDEHFTQAEIDQGLALNAAIILHDGSSLAQTQTRLMGRVKSMGLPVRIVDWRAASGLVSNFIGVINAFLYAASAVIFLIALVIMSNAMAMATASRSQELGTIRAIGGQRRLVLGMYLIETLTLGLGAGTLGALAACGTLYVLHRCGIAAVSDVMTFLFSGPRFYPTMIWRDLGFGMLSVLLVTGIAVLYPARAAVRIPPVVAMLPKE
ncbi:MAG: ABC transporter permease, partial [Deltaproteobacteria bacterium]